ncbi:MAG TPA: cyclic nucleotide-binding domain-containing protein [Acetobacteraceae bacterium]|nr:cyclic nucleotide-binding domain-containing protein [Acetobacteraceae bacterium]
MKSETLPTLSPRDWELLREHVTVIRRPRGDVILAEGGHRRAIFIVRSGAVRVEQSQNGLGIALALLGEGEIFGEMGFVENVPASASVIVQDDAELEVIEGDALESIKAADPGFSVRFYHSLAISLARRLRLTSARLSRAGAGEAAQVNRHRVARTGNITARQVPPALGDSLDQFEQTMLSVKLALRAGSLDAEAAVRQLSVSCDGVAALLSDYTEVDPLVEIGYNDLLSFRDQDHLEAGIGDYVFRETFGTLLLSATMARCYAKPRGFPDDHETMAMIAAGQAQGDDRLGPLIDRWFLDRPLCLSRRASTELMRRSLAEVVASRPAGEAIRIASLASGTAGELLDLCAISDGAAIEASLVDLDGEALQAAARRAERLGLSDRVVLVNGNVVGPPGEVVSLLPQHIAYALGLCDYLTDDEVVILLDRLYELVVPGGCALVTNLSPDNGDRLLMQHLLDWQAYHRSGDQIRDLFARSAFGDRAVEIFTDASGVTVFARCDK